MGSRRLQAELLKSRKASQRRNKHALTGHSRAYLSRPRHIHDLLICGPDLTTSAHSQTSKHIHNYSLGRGRPRSSPHYLGQLLMSYCFVELDNFFNMQRNGTCTPIGLVLAKTSALCPAKTTRETRTPTICARIFSESRSWKTPLAYPKLSSKNLRTGHVPYLLDGPLLEPTSPPRRFAPRGMIPWVPPRPATRKRPPSVLVCCTAFTMSSWIWRQSTSTICLCTGSCEMICSTSTGFLEIHADLRRGGVDFQPLLLLLGAPFGAQPHHAAFQLSGGTDKLFTPCFTFTPELRQREEDTLSLGRHYTDSKQRFANFPLAACLKQDGYFRTDRILPAIRPILLHHIGR